jgi:hypothetical protein
MAKEYTIIIPVENIKDNGSMTRNMVTVLLNIPREISTKATGGTDKEQTRVFITM